MGILLLGILVVGMFIIGYLISKQNSDEQAQESKPVPSAPFKPKPKDFSGDEIQRLQVKYGIKPSLEYSELSIKDKESYIKQILEQIAKKIDSLNHKEILTNANVANHIRHNQTWKYKKYLYTYTRDEFEEKPSNVFYVIYKSLMKNSLVTAINKDYTYAIDKEFFSFMILNDFFMTGEFKNTSHIVSRMDVKNFKFDTQGFEEIFQDLKPYLDRISTSSSYSTTRISQNLNRYIKLSNAESNRIKLELGSDFDKDRIPEYCNEMHFLEILGYDFLIKYLKKYLDMVKKLEDNVDTKSGYSQYLSKYNLTIH